jgi:trans-aconitate methyltransferase
MIKQAKKNLKSFDNVEIIHSSFTDVKLPRKVDVIFSNAALHWVLDHRKAFQNFWAMLKPMKDSSGNNDSQLLIQCGGMEIYNKPLHC